jgi:hypothetical protein
MSKNYRIRKLNGGAGALLCSKCHRIVYSGIEGEGERKFTQEEWDSKDPLYCKNCKEPDPDLTLEKIESQCKKDDILVCLENLYDDGITLTTTSGKKKAFSKGERYVVKKEIGSMLFKLTDDNGQDWFIGKNNYQHFRNSDYEEDPELTLEMIYSPEDYIDILKKYSDKYDINLLDTNIEKKIGYDDSILFIYPNFQIYYLTGSISIFSDVKDLQILNKLASKELFNALNYWFEYAEKDPEILLESKNFKIKSKKRERFQDSEEYEEHGYKITYKILLKKYDEVHPYTIEFYQWDNKPNEIYLLFYSRYNNYYDVLNIAKKRDEVTLLMNGVIEICKKVLNEYGGFILCGLSSSTNKILGNFALQNDLVIYKHFDIGDNKDFETNILTDNVDDIESWIAISYPKEEDPVVLLEKKSSYKYENGDYFIAHNEEENRQIQEHLFSLGYTWEDGFDHEADEGDESIRDYIYMVYRPFVIVINYDKIQYCNVKYLETEKGKFKQEKFLETDPEVYLERKHIKTYEAFSSYNDLLEGKKDDIYDIPYEDFEVGDLVKFSPAYLHKRMNNNLSSKVGIVTEIIVRSGYGNIVKGSDSITRKMYKQDCEDDQSAFCYNYNLEIKWNDDELDDSRTFYPIWVVKLEKDPEFTLEKLESDPEIDLGLPSPKEYKKQKLLEYIEIIPQEFWDFVDFVDWESYYGTAYLNDALVEIRHKMLEEYSEEEINRFRVIYEGIPRDNQSTENSLYNRIYDYFVDTWLDDKYSSFMPSDDGFTDLISSLIGKGKKVVIACIKNKNKFIKIAKYGDFRENFGYIFQEN